MSPTGATSLASLDGEIMLASEATIPATDEGLIRGDGVFEVIRVYDGQPYAFDEHLARLERSAANLRLPVDLEAVRADAFRLLAEAGTGPDHELLRIMITRGGRRLLLTEPMVERRPTTRGWCRSPTRRRAILDGVKSLSYAANMLAGRLAREQGYRRGAAGHARTVACSRRRPARSSASGTGELLTPPLDEHILASITRALVIEVTGAEERACTLEELYEADEVFLASTVREVQTGGVDRRPRVHGPLAGR